MQLKEWLDTTGMTMVEFGKLTGRAQSIISRLSNRKHRPDPVTAVRILKVTKERGRKFGPHVFVSLDDMYDVPQKLRCECQRTKQ